MAQSFGPRGDDSDDAQTATDKSDETPAERIARLQKELEEALQDALDGVKESTEDEEVIVVAEEIVRRCRTVRS